MAFPSRESCTRPETGADFVLPLEVRNRLLQWGYETTREYLPRKLQLDAERA